MMKHDSLRCLDAGGVENHQG